MTKKLLTLLFLFFTFGNISMQAQLILNEIHADPKSGIDGDANGDGTRAFLEDEFLEFVNLGPDYIDLSDHTYRDGVRTRMTFPSNFRLGPGEVLVIFGLPSPTGPLDPANFGGATILHASDSDGLSLTNGGDTVRIYDAMDNIVFDLEYGSDANNDQSITRSVDLVDTTFVVHNSVAPDSSLYSPGLTAFKGILSFPLLLNEIHADPINDITGDANGDGTRNSIEDEFLEFVNVSNLVLDLSGYQIADNSQNRHTFPSGTEVFPGQPLVIFGGGSPTGTFGNAVVQVSSSGNLSLTNGGDEVIMKSPAGDTILFYAYGGEANIDESITRSPDISGGNDPMTAHTVAANDTTILWSPGTFIDGSPFPFDLTGLPTVVEFSATELTVLEDVGTVELQVKISGANPDTATEVTVRVIGGTGSTVDITNFAPIYNLSFPADSNSPQIISLEIENDLDPEGDETFIYAIDAVSGPGSAIIGSQDTFTLTIQANDLDFPLLVNEIHADPKPGLEGDANGDGVRVFQEDEFIEFVNIGDSTLDISGYTYEDSRGITFHIFPEGSVVQPGEVLLLFGRPLAIPLDPANFCNAIIQYASQSSVGDGEGLSLTNGGDIVTIRDSTGQTVILESYGPEGGMDQSLNRLIDLQRVDFELHTIIAGDTTNLFSPGCAISGFNLSIREKLSQDAVNIFPNPTRGTVNIELSEGLRLEAVYVRDINGRTVMAPGIAESFDIRALPNGFYLIDVHTHSGKVVKKLLLHR